MKKMLFALLFLLPVSGFASNEDTVNGCISAWKKSPFKKNALPDAVITPSVKVLGIGKKDFEDRDATAKPKLVLIKPSVNVLGTTKFVLMNPNGWYCFKANVSVLGKISIEADCKAHIAQTSDGGANVLGSDESDHSVTVLGTVRIVRRGCADSKAEKEEAKTEAKVDSEDIKADSEPKRKKAAPKADDTKSDDESTPAPTPTSKE